MNKHEKAAHEQRQQEIAEAFWDDLCPQWREMSLDPEDRRFVPEQDVSE